MKKQANLDLTEGPILRKLLRFAFPLILGSMINNLYGTADSVMLGHFAGTSAMAAVSVGGTPLSLLIHPLDQFAVGANVACAVLIGSQKKRELTDCMHTVVIFGFLAGLFAVLLGLPLLRPLLVLSSAPESLMADASCYILLRFIGTPFGLCATFCSNIFLAHGNTKLSVTTGIVSGGANIVLNFLFIPVLRMGIVGAALGTVLSQCLSFGIYIWMLYHPKSLYKLQFKDMKLHLTYVKSILSTGIPVMLNGIVFSISNLPLTAAVNSFGPIVIAGNNAANNLDGYISMIQNCISSATLSAVAQCYGAGKYGRIKQIAIKAGLGSAGIIACLCPIMTVFAEPLLLLINPDPAVAQQGIPKMLFFIWGSVIYTNTCAVSACLKGMKKASVSTLTTSISTILPRLLWVWLLVPHLQDAFWLYAIYPISWAISLVAISIVFSYHLKKLYRQTAITA